METSWDEALGDRAAREAIGRSEAFLNLQERLSKAARVDRPVLIVGERGTGKELAARRLHYLSERWKKPLVTLHCAALAPTLVESELFGHEAGAFTGAAGRRRGRFELADGGTLFLDEIGMVSPSAQEKILRAVEYGTFERVGSSRPVQVDVRVIGATNADLRALAREGRFRRDLLDRLSFEVIRVPPLRERPEDILLLARHFAGRFAVELGRREAPSFTARAERVLLGHPWPGNVRELKNVVERAVYAADGPEIDAVVLDPFAGAFEPDVDPEGPPASAGAASAEPGPDPLALPLPEAVDRLRLAMLREALDRSRHNQRRAAELLGLSYHQFRGLYRKYEPEIRRGEGDRGP